MVATITSISKVRSSSPPRALITDTVNNIIVSMNNALHLSGVKQQSFTSGSKINCTCTILGTLIKYTDNSDIYQYSQSVQSNKHRTNELCIAYWLMNIGCKSKSNSLRNRIIYEIMKYDVDLFLIRLRNQQ